MPGQAISCQVHGSCTYKIMPSMYAIYWVRTLVHWSSPMLPVCCYPGFYWSSHYLTDTPGIEPGNSYVHSQESATKLQLLCKVILWQSSHLFFESSLHLRPQGSITSITLSLSFLFPAFLLLSSPSYETYRLWNFKACVVEQTQSNKYLRLTSKKMKVFPP